MLWVALLASCVIAVDQTVTITDPVDRIVVDVTGGDLRVTASPGPVVISADFGGPGGGPIDDSLDETELTVHYLCELCGGRLSIQAPPEVAIDVTVGAGDLTVEGMTAEIVASITAGSAHLRGVGAGPVDVELDYGDFDATFVAPPARLDGALKTGTIDVSVPGEVSYALTLETDAGRIVTDGVVDDPAAPNVIDLSANQGDIHLTGR